MPFKKTLNGKQWLLYPALLLFMTLSILGLYFLGNDRVRFYRLTRDLFISELSSSTLTLHYTFAYPENYGLSGSKPLPLYSGEESPQTEQAALSRTLSDLSRISSQKLNTEEAYAYDLLKRYLTRRLQGSEHVYYSEPFSPDSGIQSGLPILLADYTFRRKEDVEDYLNILEQTEEYFSGLLQYETAKSQAGLFMADYSAQKVIEQCDTIMNKKELAEGTHFLHTTFSERIDTLVSDGIITKKEADQYLSENDRLLTTVVQPAYEQIADTFTLLSGTGINSGGLAHLPDGRSYYEYLLSTTTGSDRSIAEIKELLYSDFTRNYDALLVLLTEYPQAANSIMTNSNSLPFSSPEEMLSSLQSEMSADFPAFPVGDGEFRTAVTLKQVVPSMEDYCAPAYYLTPPVDDMVNNIIYINGGNDYDDLTMYTTLAHEGYPGHLYQTVYSQLYISENNIPDIRYLLHYGGYVEGWAYYVENMSYRYAEKLVEQNPETAVWFEICRLNRNLHLCLYSLLDIAIHYDGATLEAVQNILQNIGINSPETVTEIYEYIVEEPAGYPKYYLGFLEFQFLQERARILWGEDFTLYRFHEFVLKAGPSDFTGLNDRLILTVTTKRQYALRTALLDNKSVGQNKANAYMFLY